jgi:beta-lactamase regulating signal transducer with metallopeptidase domain
MNLPLDAVTKLVWTQIWQVTAVIVAVGVFAKICCRPRPHLAYALWLLVLTKCLTPPLLSSPTSVFSWLTRANPAAVSAGATIPAPQVMARAASEKRPSALPDRVSETSSDSPASTNPIVPASEFSCVSMTAVFAGLWLIGAIACASVAMAVTLRLRRIIYRGSKSIEPKLHARFDDLKRQLNIRRSVRLAVIQESLGPLTFGWLRPIVVMPEALANDSIDERLKPLLAHELIHVRRGDAIVGLIQTAAQCLWWFHPLVWWANRRIVQQRERCCDEETIAGLAIEPGSYARSLLNVVETRQQWRWLVAVPGIRPLEITKRRLEHIMVNYKHFRSRMPRRYWLLIAAGTLLLLPGAGLTWSVHPGAAAEPAKAAQRSNDAPAEKMTISGKCVDENGKPVPLAQVRLFLLDSYDLYHVAQLDLDVVQTDAEGKYVFSGVDLGLLRAHGLPQEFHATLFVVAQSPGKATAGHSWTGLAQGRDATIEDLTLATAFFALQGRMTDVDGKPVAGAIVSSGWLPDPIPGIGAAVTDADGHYIIPDLRAFDFDNQPQQRLKNPFGGKATPPTFEVRHPDFGRQRFEYRRVPSTVNATVQRAAVVEGQIRFAENGKPAIGVRVEFSNDKIYPEYWTRAKTDDQGRYRLVELPPGNYQLSTKLAGYANLSRQDMRLNAGLNTLDLKISKGGVIAGHIVDISTGKAPNSCENMSLIGSVHGTVYPGMPYADVQPDGTFKMRVPAGRNYFGFYNSFNYSGVNTDKYLEKGVDVAEGETVEVEIRVKPRKPEDESDK